MSQELTECKNTLEKTANWDKTIDDCGVLVELYNETEDESLWEELQNTLESLEKSLNEWEVQTTLSGEYDTYDAILTVNAGAGGTDAQDWAEMLLRMYMRWAEKKGWKVELLDKSEGDEAGIKSATIKLTGKFSISQNAVWDIPIFLGISKFSPYRDQLRRGLTKISENPDSKVALENLIKKEISQNESLYSGVVAPDFFEKQ